MRKSKHADIQPLPGTFGFMNIALWLFLNVLLLGASTVGSLFGLIFLQSRHVIPVNVVDLVVVPLYIGIYTLIFCQLFAPGYFNYHRMRGRLPGTRLRRWHSSFISARRLRASKRAGVFTIFVRGTFGGTISMLASPHSTVDDIQNVLRKRGYVPPSWMSDHYFTTSNNTRLMPFKSLVSLGIGSLSHIHVRVPFLGGAEFEQTDEPSNGPLDLVPHPPPTTHRCRDCGLTFDNHHSLKTHSRNNHQTELKFYESQHKPTPIAVFLRTTATDPWFCRYCHELGKHYDSVSTTAFKAHFNTKHRADRIRDPHPNPPTSNVGQDGSSAESSNVPEVMATRTPLVPLNPPTSNIPEIRMGEMELDQHPGPSSHHAVPPSAAISTSSLQPTSSSVAGLGDATPTSADLVSADAAPIGQNNVVACQRPIVPDGPIASTSGTVGPEEAMPLAPQPSPDDFQGIYIPHLLPDFVVQSPLLERYSLVLDTREKTFICCRCGQAVRASTLQAHFRGRDGHEQDVRELSLENITREHGTQFSDIDIAIVPDQLPSHPIPYLTIKDGFTCVAPTGAEPCFRTLALRHKIVLHQKECHPNEPSHTIKPTSMQTFFHARLARYFPIHKVTAIAADFADYWRTWVDVADNHDEAPAEAPQPRNEREREPFFRRHPWYEVFAKHDKRKLLEFHSGQPRVGVHWESRLSKFIHEHYDRLSQEIETLHWSVEKTLSQKDEGSEHAFTKLTDKATLRTYASSTVRYALSVLRYMEAAYPQYDTHPMELHDERPIPNLDGLPFIYYLTHAVEDYAQKLLWDLQTVLDEEDLHNALHDFLYALFTEAHPAVGGNFYTCPATCHTMMNQLQQDLLFKRPGIMSSSIAGDQWCMRATFMLEMIKRAQQDAEDAALPAVEGQPAPESFPDYVAAADTIFKEAMCPKLRTSPYQSIQYWLRQTKKAAERTTGDASIIWAEGENTLLYDGNPLKLDQLKKFSRVFTSTLEEYLKCNILLDVPLNIQLPAVIHDDVTNRTIGHDWTQNERNRTFTEQYSNHYFVRKHVFSNTEIATKFFGPLEADGTRSILTRYSRAWLQNVRRFKIDLAIAMLMFCSGSARGEEQLILFLRENGTMRRSIVAMGQEFLFLCEYGKMAWNQAKFTPIPRILYSRLRDMVVAYQLVVEPFELVLRREQLRQKSKLFEETKNMLFVDHLGRFSAREISEYMAATTEGALGIRIQMADCSCEINAQPPSAKKSAFGKSRHFVQAA